jgi:hypothetical protein
MKPQMVEIKTVEGLSTADVQGAELAVVNTRGVAFTIRRFRRSRGDYYVVRHPLSGTIQRFSALEKAKSYMLAAPSVQQNGKP